MKIFRQHLFITMSVSIFFCLITCYSCQEMVNETDKNNFALENTQYNNDLEQIARAIQKIIANHQNVNELLKDYIQSEESDDFSVRFNDFIESNVSTLSTSQSKSLEQTSVYDLFKQELIECNEYLNDSKTSICKYK